MASTLTQTLTHLDDLLCCDQQQDDNQHQEPPYEAPSVQAKLSPGRCLSGGAESRVERAWAWWSRLGRPKLIVVPMVDNSELPFRMRRRKYGATATYTLMLHSRIFTENEKYRSQEFTTCKEDRPLFVQFCANDPDILVEAARRVEPYCDYVDIYLGCPQRIAGRGSYGAFLMDKLTVVKSPIEKLALNLEVSVSCKIHLFLDLQDTIKYARMLEAAGCSLLAVDGRTRDEKDGKKMRANWDAIEAVKESVRIPVIANGNIRHMDDVHSCLVVTGVEGVLTAKSLLENPALFAGFQTAKWVVVSEESSRDGKLDQADLLVEYLKLCEQYPVPWRMIRVNGCSFFLKINLKNKKQKTSSPFHMASSTTAGMENLSEDLLADIFQRLSDEKEVVRCMSVSKSWYHTITGVLRLRFWEESPIVGLYFRTMETFKKGMGRISRFHPPSARQKYLSDIVSLSNSHNINYVAIPRRAHHESYPNTSQIFMDCCNGLLLLFHLKYKIYYVWNPFTRQRADLPKHHNVHDSHYRDNVLFAALAFDPAESSFYRVVLLQRCTNNLEYDDDHCLIDIFSSETGEWKRTRLKLDPTFIRDYSNSKARVPHVYLRRVLYRMASSRKVSRIEVGSMNGNASDRGPIDLPPIPVNIDRTVGACDVAGIDDWGVMGCLGVSVGCLSFCKREWTTFGVWLYHEQSGEWISRYTVSFNHLKSTAYKLGLCYYLEIFWMEPVALGPNSDVMFFGLQDKIFSYNFKTNMVKLVCETSIFKPAYILGCFFPVFVYRTCLLPFQGLDKKSVRCTPLHVAYSSDEISFWDVTFRARERWIKECMAKEYGRLG